MPLVILEFHYKELKFKYIKKSLELLHAHIAVTTADLTTTLFT